jgi:hypothetical protein
MSRKKRYGLAERPLGKANALEKGPTAMEEIQSLISESVRTHVLYRVDREHDTYLTINRSSSVQTDIINYHAEETSHTREGVNL